MKVFKYDFMRNSTPMCRTSTVHKGSGKKTSQSRGTEVCYVMKEQSTTQQIFRHPPKSTQANKQQTLQTHFLYMYLRLKSTFSPICKIDERKMNFMFTL